MLFIIAALTICRISGAEVDKSLLAIYLVDRPLAFPWPKLGPASLQELVAARYLASIPKDPFSGRDDTWVVEISSNPKLPGVVDVHSGSHDISSNGDRYSAW